MFLLTISPGYIMHAQLYYFASVIVNKDNIFQGFNAAQVKVKLSGRVSGNGHPQMGNLYI
jgi:hypothetical protein